MIDIERMNLLAWIADTLPSSTFFPAKDNDEAAILIVSSTHAMVFQIGVFQDDDGHLVPLLAYPPALWWWPRVWEGISLLDAPAALIFHTHITEQQYQIVMPIHLPKAARSLSQSVGSKDWYCTPYSTTYIHRASASTGQRPTISEESDLDFDFGVIIPHKPFTIEGDSEWVKSLPQFR